MGLVACFTGLFSVTMRRGVQTLANLQIFANLYLKFATLIREKLPFKKKNRIVAITEQIQVQMCKFLLLICDFLGGSAHP